MKCQTPAPLPPRLLAQLRRWNDRKLIANCFVEFNGKSVASVTKGFKTAVGLARLPGRVTLRTSCATPLRRLMQRGVPIWKAAGFPEVLQNAYGHHHVSVAETVVNLTGGQNQTKKPNEIWSEWQDLNLRPLRPERE
jgi:hypothetical protein